MLSSMARIEDNVNVPTMGVGFIRGSIPALFYNSNFVKKISQEELFCVLNHECQHIGLMHLQRGSGFDREIANLAMDVIVNFNIPALDNLPKFKKNLCTQDAFKELKKVNIRESTWEDIYYLIKPAIDKDRKKFQKWLDKALREHKKWHDSKGGAGKEMTPEQVAAFKNLLSNSAKKMDGQDYGNLPGAIKRLIDDLQRVKFNWRQQLSIFAQTCAKEDKTRTWKKPNRRFGMYAPGTRKDFKPRLLGVIDNSGSIGANEYSKFVAHMCKIADACESIDGIGVDTQVNFEFEFKRGGTPSYDDIKSGGGTSFQPAFDYAKGKGYDGIIYFTDGYASNDIQTYGIPALFAVCAGGAKVNGFRNIEIDVDPDGTN